MNTSMWSKLRKEKGVTQLEIAEEFGIRKSTVSMYENGKRKMPYKMQIKYLKFRNNDKDKILIEYMEGMIKNGINR